MARAQAKIMLVFPSMIEMNTEDLEGMALLVGVNGYSSLKKIDLAEMIQEAQYPDLMKAKSTPKAKAKKAVNLGSASSINIIKHLYW